MALALVFGYDLWADCNIQIIHNRFSLKRSMLIYQLK